MNTYIRDDGIVMREVSPGNFVRAQAKPINTSWRFKMSEKDANRVFGYLQGAPKGLTADECAALRESEDADGLPKVNLVAPVLTIFKSAGITKIAGRRRTRTGSTARVHQLTPDARSILLSGGR